MSCSQKDVVIMCNRTALSCGKNGYQPTMILMPRSMSPRMEGIPDIPKKRRQLLPFQNAEVVLPVMEIPIWNVRRERWVNCLVSITFKHGNILSF